MKTLFDAIWDEIMDPNGGRLALSHYRATTAGAHALLGAGSALAAQGRAFLASVVSRHERASRGAHER